MKFCARLESSAVTHLAWLLVSVLIGVATIAITLFGGYPARPSLGKTEVLLGAKPKGAKIGASSLNKDCPRIGDRDYPFGGNTWHVLDIQDGEALLLMNEIHEKRWYHYVNVPISWERCDLRKYLNDVYLGTFSKED